MTKKMIAVDLDGTLLNGESKLSDFTKRFAHSPTW